MKNTFEVIIYAGKFSKKFTVKAITRIKAASAVLGTLNDGTIDALKSRRIE